LSHPNLTAYLFRDDLISSLIDENINWKTRFIIAAASIIPKKILKKQINKMLTSGKHSPKDIVANCLSFFEIPLEYQFLVLEHFLKSEEPNVFNNQNQIMVNKTCYDKIVLCPLVIDFGYKNIENSIFYNLTPARPVINQIGDLLYAIRTYYRFTLNIKKNKMTLSDEIQEFQEHKHEKLFEIYPFMGIDTRNYSLKAIEIMLNKYFRNFSKTESKEERRARLFEKMGKLDSNMYRDNIEYADVFAGIKVYPQLGFDPYPNDTTELEKVEYLYQFCTDKRIPIVTHCSDAGFKVGDYDALTVPNGKWKKVLEKYSELTLNFAHFGSESKSEKRHWRNTIIALTKQYPNVYTDISCNDAKPEYYNEIELLFHPDSKKKQKNALPVSNPELYKKILFGSDFSINLLASKVDSYNEYLKAFLDAKIQHKEFLCEKNPERFLFGG
jgi:uncharacterized protein YdcH (DUF465 family)